MSTEVPLNLTIGVGFKRVSSVRILVCGRCGEQINVEYRECSNGCVNNGRHGMHGPPEKKTFRIERWERTEIFQGYE